MSGYRRLAKPAHVPFWKPVSIVTASGERLFGHFEPAIPIRNKWNRVRAAS